MLSGADAPFDVPNQQLVPVLVGKRWNCIASALSLRRANIVLPYGCEPADGLEN
jgi:hypothetical protein